MGVHLACKVHKVHLVHLAHKERRVHKVNKVQLVSKVQLAQLVHVVHPAHKVFKATKERRVTKVFKVSKVILVIQVWLVFPVHQVNKVTLVWLVRQVQLVHVVTLVHEVPSVHPVQMVKMVFPVCRVPVVNLVSPVSPVWLAHLVPLAHLLLSCSPHHNPRDRINVMKQSMALSQTMRCKCRSSSLLTPSSKCNRQLVDQRKTQLALAWTCSCQLKLLVTSLCPTGTGSILTAAAKPMPSRLSATSRAVRPVSTPTTVLSNEAHTSMDTLTNTFTSVRCRTVTSSTTHHVTMPSAVPTTNPRSPSCDFSHHKLARWSLITARTRLLPSTKPRVTTQRH